MDEKNNNRDEAMTRAELREKAKESWKLAALRASHFGDTEAEQTIEYFGIEIAKSVAEDLAKISEGHNCSRECEAVDSSCEERVALEIREYAKRLEGDEK